MLSWDPAATAGLLRLPSGRLVRARGLGETPPGGAPPQFAIYLLDRRPTATPWPARWVSWPDFGLPSNPAVARAALQEGWRRAEMERVEVACWGGHGRTGTALACLAVLDGLSSDLAVEYVRRNYRVAAVETPEQEDFILRFQ